MPIFFVLLVSRLQQESSFFTLHGALDPNIAKPPTRSEPPSPVMPLPSSQVSMPPRASGSGTQESSVPDTEAMPSSRKEKVFSHLKAKLALLLYLYLHPGLGDQLVEEIS